MKGRAGLSEWNGDSEEDDLDSDESEEDRVEAWWLSAPDWDANDHTTVEQQTISQVR